MDISHTLEPNSDQLDAVDLLGGPRTFSIAGVRKGNAEQPVQIDLSEFPRPWRPGKSMRRVLVACWGPDASTYVGRRVRLYCDPEVMFGGAAVGGTRIAALSHIDKPKPVPLLVSRGKSKTFTVQPLPADAPQGDASPDPLKEVGRLMKKAGITERAHAATYVSDVVGREVGSTKELTGPEVEALIESLKREVGEE